MSELRISCAWCSPPGSATYDPDASHGLCGRHFLEMRARILKTRSAGPSPRDGDTSALGVSAAGPAAISHGATAPHSPADADTREERKHVR